jgi:hypothetical protein
MKFRRALVMAASGVLAVGALAGATGTGMASAATGTRLCIDDGSAGNFCALAGIGQWGVEMYYQSPGSNGYSDWLYPTQHYPNGAATGRIQEAGTNNCLQIDHDSSPANMIRLAACGTDDAEKWTNYYNPLSKRTEWQSYWAANDDGGGVSLCMSFDISDGDVLRADPCEPGGGTTNWYQQFGSS